MSKLPFKLLFHSSAFSQHWLSQAVYSLTIFYFYLIKSHFFHHETLYLCYLIEMSIKFIETAAALSKRASYPEFIFFWFRHAREVSVFQYKDKNNATWHTPQQQVKKSFSFFFLSPSEIAFNVPPPKSHHLIFNEICQRNSIKLVSRNERFALSAVSSNGNHFRGSRIRDAISVKCEKEACPTDITIRSTKSKKKKKLCGKKLIYMLTGWCIQEMERIVLDRAKNGGFGRDT